tara:strand:- start:4152 stop:4841 length:690 start_codon:yes stop_codon:yes gene_type:complete
MSYNNTGKELLKSAAKTDLKSSTLSLAEKMLDGNLDDGIIKDIPVLSTLIGIGKTFNNIRDYLFAKKLVSFLSGLENMDPNKRAIELNQINSNLNYQQQVGEKLLFILDRCEDQTKAFYVAKLFVAFLSKDINYNEFLEACAILERCFLNDLARFLNSDLEYLEGEFSAEDQPYDEAFPWFNAGLMHNTISSVKMEGAILSELDKPQKVTIRIWVNPVGRIIHKCLNNN